MKTITFTLPTIDEVTITLEPLEEDTPVRGNALMSGDKKQDKLCEDGIIRRLENGDIWAWFTAKVVASFNGVESDAEYLGCCSGSEKDFKKCDYYEDMRQAAYDNLIEKLERFESK